MRHFRKPVARFCVNGGFLAAQAPRAFSLALGRTVVLAEAIASENFFEAVF